MNSKIFMTVSSVLFLFMSVSLACRKPVSIKQYSKQPSLRDSVGLDKFEPANGQVIVFVGQDLESIGGTSNYGNGYFDAFPAPGGFTHYTAFRANSPYSLPGLTETVNWGDGPENMTITTSSVNFGKSCLAIGLDLTEGNDFATAEGKNDGSIVKLGNWIKAKGERPVFLRIGYEFDGADWNHYDKDAFKAAWRRIKDKFVALGVKNVAYVWQSKGAGSNRETLDSFYPGDEYVDWVAFSFFTAAEENHPMIKFARDHKKPLFIAESTPVILDNNGVSIPLDLGNTADVNRAWEQWFVPFFRTINNNQDVIKAIHYINSPWKTRPQWRANPYFKNIDARITRNDVMKNLWLGEISKPKYLKASDTLFNYLKNKN